MTPPLRQLTRQTLVYGTGNVLTRLVTFLLLPLFTNVLTPGEYGLATLLYVFLGFMNIVYHYGLDTAFMRYYNEADGPDAQQSLFSTALWLSLGTSCVLSFLILSGSSGLSSLLLGGDQYTHLFKLAAGILLLDAISHVPFAHLRLEGRATLFVLIKLINVITTLGMNIYLVVMKGMGLDGIFLSVAAASAVTTFSVLSATAGSLQFAFNSSSVSSLLKFGLPFLPAGLASIAMESIDRYILASLTDAATVGIYTAGYKLGIFMLLITTAFQYAWQPFFLKAGNNSESKTLFARVFSYFMVIALFVWTVITLFISEIVRLNVAGVSLIGPAFVEAQSIVPIILMAYVFQGAYLNFLPGIYFEEKTKYIAVITGLSAAVNIGVNFALIPIYGIVGAAYATLAGHGTMAVTTYFTSKKLFPVLYDWFKLLRTVTAVVVALGTAHFFDYTLLGRIAGASAFTGALFMLKVITPGEVSKIISVFQPPSEDTN
ncbi:MAG TPA: oligosaccharide flippase family protein [Candidatus Marinimicrobia bacterium]|nr:oligosaccharide flippase family protein [Candidatus Neomarinimicrobiota bacterium]MDP7484076.1 oligosaccharide flippase family protein [Candidatus Neomarinimicrobiota bacterium]MDP7528002.1 oligosaccharide flippase family protein [Candidatus Neomarinimicrobiota bacterium]HJM85550.1 oligosaccharide flippase family protein [Candidatus Neomarinimicrobiota bacterium]